ncbi:MAG: uroporphyrinogen-III C-methyltransferase, partial [Planctomycetota bacterium]|nr:uroporphyrinogen-III C-methyltransferase [Planctomycetota bacterium]
MPTDSVTAMGKVYLVGAGPGDPGLITVRGAECLALADLVLYDGLANPLLLRLTQGVCERTARARRDNVTMVSQAEINARLIQEAQAGRTVVRLKGGDPYIFGRGSEEAAALHDAGIPFEVVPGVTAATGAGEYAGFSFTHREISSSVAFVTGHEDPGREKTRLNYKALASFPGTLVFYMGFSRLQEICENLQ